MKILLDSDTTIPSGIALKLTIEQIQAHRFELENSCLGNDIFVGRKPLEFKAGEIIEIAGELQAGILPIYDQIKAVEDKTAIIAEPEEPVKPAAVVPESGVERKHRKPKHSETADG